VKIHNRWFQLVASLIAMIMIANLQYAWTLFVKPLQAGTGWKLSDIQVAATLFILFQTWAQPCQGWLIDRMGPRLFISIAGILCGIAAFADYNAAMPPSLGLPLLVTLCVPSGNSVDTHARSRVTPVSYSASGELSGATQRAWAG